RTEDRLVVSRESASPSSVLCPLSSVLCPLSSVLCPLSSVFCPLLPVCIYYLSSATLELGDLLEPHRGFNIWRESHGVHLAGLALCAQQSGADHRHDDDGNPSRAASQSLC